MEDADTLCFSKSYQTLNILISSGRSKEFLGKNITLKDLDSMTGDQLDAFYKIYELNYADKINSNIINGIVDLYSRAVNRVLPIDDVEKLSQDLKNDYILTSELKNITAGVAAVCGKLMSVFSLGLITFKHLKVQTKPEEICNEELSNEQTKELEIS
jgi:hypothetical protein